MNKTRSKTIFFLFFLIPHLLLGNDYQNIDLDSFYTSQIRKELESEIINYVQSNSLEPFMESGACQFAIAEVFEDADIGIYYVFGELRRKDETIFALFSIDRGWISNATKLVYLSTNLLFSPDDLEYYLSIISSILEKDVSKYIIFVNRNESDSDYEEILDWFICSDNLFITLTTKVSHPPEALLRVTIEFQ